MYPPQNGLMVRRQTSGRELNIREKKSRKKKNNVGRHGKRKKIKYYRSRAHSVFSVHLLFVPYSFSEGVVRDERKRLVSETAPLLRNVFLDLDQVHPHLLAYCSPTVDVTRTSRVKHYDYVVCRFS